MEPTARYGKMVKKCPQVSPFEDLKYALQRKQMWTDTKHYNVNQRTSEVILTAEDKLLKTHRESLKLLLLRDMND